MKRNLVAVLNIIVDGIVMESFVLPVSCDTRTQFQNTYLTDGIIHRITKSEYTDKALTVVRKEFVEALTSLNLEELVKLFKYREIENALGLKDVVVSGVKVPVFNVKLANNSVDLSLMDSTEVDCNPIVVESTQLPGVAMSGVVTQMPLLQDVFRAAVEMEIRTVCKVYDILDAYKPEKVNTFYLPCTNVRELNTRFYSNEIKSNETRVISLCDITNETTTDVYTFTEHDMVERVTISQVSILNATTVSIKIHRKDEAIMICFSTDKQFIGSLITTK